MERTLCSAQKAPACPLSRASQVISAGGYEHLVWWCFAVFLLLLYICYLVCLLLLLLAKCLINSFIWNRKYGYYNFRVDFMWSPLSYENKETGSNLCLCLCVHEPWHMCRDQKITSGSPPGALTLGGQACVASYLLSHLMAPLYFSIGGCYLLLNVWNVC